MTDLVFALVRSGSLRRVRGRQSFALAAKVRFVSVLHGDLRLKVVQQRRNRQRNGLVIGRELGCSSALQKQAFDHVRVAHERWQAGELGRHTHVHGREHGSGVEQRLNVVRPFHGCEIDTVLCDCLDASGRTM